MNSLCENKNLIFTSEKFCFQFTKCYEFMNVKTFFYFNGHTLNLYILFASPPSWATRYIGIDYSNFQLVIIWKWSQFLLVMNNFFSIVNLIIRTGWVRVKIWNVTPRVHISVPWFVYDAIHHIKVHVFFRNWILKWLIPKIPWV